MNMKMLNEVTLQSRTKWCKDHLPWQTFLSLLSPYKNKIKNIGDKEHSSKRRGSSGTYNSTETDCTEILPDVTTFTQDDEHISIFICPSNLIRRGEWSALEKVLDIMHINDNNLEAICSCETCLGSQSLLHLACQYQPPLRTVRDLIKCFCGSGCQADFYKNQHPLHIALNNNATIEVIMCLLAFNKSAAMIEDTEGRTPLHILLYQYPENWPDYPFRQVVDKLCEAAPLSLTMIDECDMKPLDYALLNSSDDHIRETMHARTEYANQNIMKISKLAKLCCKGNKLAQFLLAVGNSRNVRNLGY